MPHLLFAGLPFCRTREGIEGLCPLGRESLDFSCAPLIMGAFFEEICMAD